MAVVKANAYGHGAGLVTPVMAPHVDWMGVDSLEEALELERVGVVCPTLILGHSPPTAAATIVRQGFRQGVFRRDVAEALAKAGERVGREALVHLKVETGLNRLGVLPSELPSWAEWLKEKKFVRLEGLYTHFADVEDVQSSFYEKQLERLRAAAEVLEKEGIEIELVHAAPTAGVLAHEASRFRLGRVGIGLYGIWPSPAVKQALQNRVELSPVLTWKTRLVQVKPVSSGETVGYDRTYRATKDRLVGIIPVGYADGFDRKLSNSGAALVGGKKAPVIGRVAMNMTMLDVSDCQVDSREAQADDEVVLIGQQGKESLSAEALAESSGTIAYEVLARLSVRIPRRLTSTAG